MQRSLPVLVGVLVFALRAHPAVAQQARVLTPETVVELASTQNPEVLVARTRVTQAEGVLTTARVRLPANPELDAFLGSRNTSGPGTAFEPEFSLLQRFEIGAQRRHRVAAATALVSQRTFDVATAALQAQTAALASFYRAVHALQLGRIAEEALALADEAVRAARARYEAGETAILDVNVAQVELARGRRDQLAAQSSLESALGELREVLALPPHEALRLDAPLQPEGVAAVDALVARLSERADIQAMRAGLTQAEAEWRLARAARRPDLFGGIGFRREEGEPVSGVRLGFTLPLFQRHTGSINAAAARMSEAKAALDARQNAAETRLRAAHARYTSALKAAEVMTSSAVPLLGENEELAREAYRAGKIGLLELIVIRREGVAARREALDAQFAAVLAAIEVRATAGVVR
jgi:cobalt-zinc-cadmium efflux system outer membrane protein